MIKKMKKKLIKSKFSIKWKNIIKENIYQVNWKLYKKTQTINLMIIFIPIVLILLTIWFFLLKDKINFDYFNKEKNIIIQNLEEEEEEEVIGNDNIIETNNQKEYNLIEIKIIIKKII